MGFSTTAKNTMLDSITVNRVRVHSGSPGPSGTDNVLGSLTAAVFDAAASGQRALNADVTLTGLGASQAVRFVSFWHSTGPNFHGSHSLSGSNEANALGEYTLLASGTALKLIDPV